MSMFQRDPNAGIFFGGDRVSGQDIRDQNGMFALVLDEKHLLIIGLVDSDCGHVYR